jgi:hypothetical protein
LFFRLSEITHDERWRDLIRRAARATIASGVPEQQSPGYWNNISQCCGNAGVADFFLDLHRTFGDPSYLAFSRRVTADTMRRATDDADGLRWVQAEHRVKPELLVAQTGFMQGAAGVGTLLLHLDAFERGARPSIAFPDTPFV